MIEMSTMNKKEFSKDNNTSEINKDNDQVKEEKKENRSPSQRIPSDKKENKVNIKNQKLNTEININLSVGDINKMLLRQQKISASKLNLFRFYISITLLFTNTTFIFFLAYLRPIFRVNKYYCYDLQSKNYYKCLTNTFCNCNHNYCVTFCYDEDYSKCYQKFIDDNNKLKADNLINPLATQRKGILETKIIYPIKNNENVSLFQKIGIYYCFMAYYDTFFMFTFGLGCFVGYFLFGIIADLYGKKKVIITLSILVFIFNGGIAIIANFDISKNFVVLLVLWFIFIFFLGTCLEPLESAIYVYFLEMYPSSDFIKPINCLLFVRYLISLGILVTFDRYLRNLIYYLYGYEGYILIFIFVFGFVFTETPRFYSERQDNENKAKALCFFTVNDVNFSFKENEDDSNEYMTLIKNQQNKYKLGNNYNQKNTEIKNINYSYIRYKLNTDNRISKRFYIILFSYFIISYCFYTILLKFIYFFCDPHNEISLGVIIRIFALMIVFFILMQILSYFVFEIVALNICISILLIVLFFCSIFFDVEELYLDSYRDNLFDPELIKKNETLLSTCLWFIIYVIGIYEMMLLLLSPTLYRSYFFFSQKGFTYFSLGFSFFLVYFCEYAIFIVSILLFFSIFLFLIMRVKWKYDSFEEEINKKLKIL